MTPEEMAACASEGRYWFMRSDGSFYGTDDYGGTPGDTYLLNASPEWIAQWDDWAHAATVMEAEGLFARLTEGDDS